MALARTAAVVIAMLLPAAAMANGPHAQVGCTGCHGVPGVQAKKQNMRTSAFCLDCHEVPSAPLHASHPVGRVVVDVTPPGVEPTTVKVPQDLLRAGRLECQSCHDPHPSNPNYTYLRVDVGSKGENQDRLCALCHAEKPGVETR